MRFDTPHHWREITQKIIANKRKTFCLHFKTRAQHHLTPASSYFENKNLEQKFLLQKNFNHDEMRMIFYETPIEHGSLSCVA